MVRANSFLLFAAAAGAGGVSANWELEYSLTSCAKRPAVCDRISKLAKEPGCSGTPPAPAGKAPTCELTITATNSLTSATLCARTRPAFYSPATKSYIYETGVGLKEALKTEGYELPSDASVIVQSLATEFRGAKCTAENLSAHALAAASCDAEVRVEELTVNGFRDATPTLEVQGSSMGAPMGVSLTSKGQCSLTADSQVKPKLVAKIIELLETPAPVVDNFESHGCPDMSVGGPLSLGHLADLVHSEMKPHCDETADVSFDIFTTPAMLRRPADAACDPARERVFETLTPLKAAITNAGLLDQLDSLDIVSFKPHLITKNCKAEQLHFHTVSAMQCGGPYKHTFNASIENGGYISLNATREELKVMAQEVGIALVSSDPRCSFHDPQPTADHTLTVRSHMVINTPPTRGKWAFDFQLSKCSHRPDVCDEVAALKDHENCKTASPDGDCKLTITATNSMTPYECVASRVNEASMMLNTAGFVEALKANGYKLRPGVIAVIKNIVTGIESSGCNAADPTNGVTASAVSAATCRTTTVVNALTLQKNDGLLTVTDGLTGRVIPQALRFQAAGTCQLSVAANSTPTLVAEIVDDVRKPTLEAVEVKGCRAESESGTVGLQIESNAPSTFQELASYVEELATSGKCAENSSVKFLVNAYAQTLDTAETATCNNATSRLFDVSTKLKAELGASGLTDKMKEMTLIGFISHLTPKGCSNVAESISFLPLDRLACNGLRGPAVAATLALTAGNVAMSYSDMTAPAAVLLQSSVPACTMDTPTTSLAALLTFSAEVKIAPPPSRWSFDFNITKCAERPAYCDQIKSLANHANCQALDPASKACVLTVTATNALTPSACADDYVLETRGELKAALLAEGYELPPHVSVITTNITTGLQSDCPPDHRLHVSAHEMESASCTGTNLRDLKVEGNSSELVLKDGVINFEVPAAIRIRSSSACKIAPSSSQSAKLVAQIVDPINAHRKPIVENVSFENCMTQDDVCQGRGGSKALTFAELATCIERTRKFCIRAASLSFDVVATPKILHRHGENSACDNAKARVFDMSTEILAALEEIGLRKSLDVMKVAEFSPDFVTIGCDSNKLAFHPKEDQDCAVAADAVRLPATVDPETGFASLQETDEHLTKNLALISHHPHCSFSAGQVEKQGSLRAKLGLRIAGTLDDWKLRFALTSCKARPAACDSLPGLTNSPACAANAVADPNGNCTLTVTGTRTTVPQSCQAKTTQEKSGDEPPKAFFLDIKTGLAAALATAKYEIPSNVAVITYALTTGLLAKECSMSGNNTIHADELPAAACSAVDSYLSSVSVRVGTASPGPEVPPVAVSVDEALAKFELPAAIKFTSEGSCKIERTIDNNEFRVDGLPKESIQVATVFAKITHSLEDEVPTPTIRNVSFPACKAAQPCGGEGQETFTFEELAECFARNQENCEGDFEALYEILTTPSTVTRHESPTCQNSLHRYFDVYSEVKEAVEKASFSHPIEQLSISSFRPGFSAHSNCAAENLKFYRTKTASCQAEREGDLLSATLDEKSEISLELSSDEKDILLTSGLELESTKRECSFHGPAVDRHHSLVLKSRTPLTGAAGSSSEGSSSEGSSSEGSSSEGSSSEGSTDGAASAVALAAFAMAVAVAVAHV